MTKTGFAQLNQVIDYIESHLEENIDYSTLEKIAICSPQQLPRLFTFISGITLTEYIRKRRLSVAAEMIRTSTQAISSIGMKYGYESQAAFSRAFKELHGVSPSQLRKKGDMTIKDYPRLIFHLDAAVEQLNNYRVVDGEVKKAEVVHSEFLPFGPYKLIGKEIRAGFMSQDISQFWGRCFGEGVFDTLLSLEGFIPELSYDKYIGYVRDVDAETGIFTYVIGLFMEVNAPIPSGFVSYDVPSCTLAKVWVQGEELDIYPNGPTLSRMEITKKGYQVDDKNYFLCEVYTDERFEKPKMLGEKTVILDYYLPCKSEHDSTFSKK